MSDGKPVRIDGDPEGYDVEAFKPDGRGRCFSCALHGEPGLCGPAPCLPMSRSAYKMIIYVKKQGGK